LLHGFIQSLIVNQCFAGGLGKPSGFKNTGRRVHILNIALSAIKSNPLDNLTHPAMLNPVAVCCGSAGLATRGTRRKETAQSLDSSGFLLRNTWQALLWAGYVGEGNLCRFLVPGSPTRIVPPALFGDRAADLIRTRRFTMSNQANIPALLRTACPVVQIENGQAVTLSTEVARVFGKQHKNVIRDIESLLSDLPASGQLNFEPTTIQVEISGATNASGATRDSKAYHLTRDGFTLLAMGFTGKKALAFKLAYIEAFNQMERELSGKAGQLPPPIIPNPPTPPRLLPQRSSLRGLSL